MKYVIVFIGFILFGCARVGDANIDTPTSGEIKIAVDESLQPLMDAEIKAFEGIYRNAKIIPLYVSEAEAVKLLIGDSVRLAVITRSLTVDEKLQIKSQKVTAQESKVAREGVALIVNQTNTDTLWDMSKLRGTRFRFVFDDRNSGIARLLRDSVAQGKGYAVQGSERVVDYIKEDKSAVGLIGASWISDRDDSIANQFLRSVKVLAIKGSDNDYYQPYQAYIAQKLYPFTRDVVINSREPRSGLGTGFTSFVAGDKGQRVVLKAGLVPVTMPVRVVEIVHESLNLKKP